MEVLQFSEPNMRAFRLLAKGSPSLIVATHGVAGEGMELALAGPNPLTP